MSLSQRSVRHSSVAWAMCLGLLGGCASTDTALGYYGQSVAGHLTLMKSARPVQDWLDDPRTEPTLVHRLKLAQRLRRFAVTELGLPDNASYQNYGELGRDAAVYNVVAAPALSLKLKQWCFLLVGCVGYRGYFDQAQARAFAQRLTQDEQQDEQHDEQMEVSVYPVSAYSTLGWMNWAGGDPLLDTFIHLPEGDLARLVFHELAHQQLYVPGDTAFSESFASAVERLGSALWLAQAAPEVRQEDALRQRRRQDLRALTHSTRERLQALYDDTRLSRASKLAMKADVLADMHRQYAQLRQRWGGYSGFDSSVAQINNARLGVQQAYDQWVSAFEGLFEQQGRDFRRFYAEVQSLARLPQAQRQARLQSAATVNKVAEVP